MTDAIVTRAEAERLAALESTIQRGLKTFVDVGMALREIRDGRLYRATHDTFEDYCQDRWGFTRMRASQMIAASDVVGNVNHGLQIEPPTSERQIRPLARLEPDQQREAWREAVETAPDGKVTGAHVELVVGRMMRPVVHGPRGDYYRLANDVKECAVCGELWAADLDYCPYCHVPQEERIAYLRGERDAITAQRVDVTVFSSRSEEYYTPTEYIEAARRVLGGIDLDPASCLMAQVTVKATRFYTKETDGLMQPWSGRVWLNPPYGTTGGESNQGIWAAKLIEEHESGNVPAAILLVKAALGYEWFESLWYEWPVCFPRRRLSFGMPDGSDDGQSKQASALFYFGDNLGLFTEVFRQFGRVIMPEEKPYGTL